MGAILKVAMLLVLAQTRNDAAIQEVQSGARTEANAAWWGYNAEDATDSLQAAIDSGAKTVVVPYTGQPWSIRPVKLRSGLELVFEPGVVVLAKEGEFKGKGDSLFTAADMENITVRGYGATLRMRKADYQKPPYEPAEWRMGLAFRGCEKVRVEGLRIESTGGDGIYIGATGNRPYCKDVEIRDVVCHDNHRQGISVITAENLLIEDCVLSNTDGTAPQAGIDFEPNGADERLINCVMRRCRVENNTGNGILLYLRPLSRESQPISMVFEDCLMQGGAQAGINVSAIDDDGPDGTVEFRNCTVENPGREGACISGKAADNVRVRFVNCRFNGSWGGEVGEGKSPHVPILINAGRKDSVTTVGGIDFVDCRVYDTADRPAITYSPGEGGPALQDVTGTVVVQNPHGAKVELPEGLELKVVAAE